MKNVFRILLPLVILTLCGYAAWWLYRNQPVAEFREMPPSLVRVEGTVLRKTTHQVIAHSQGTVQPRTRSTLLPEVSAKVIEIGESFRPGGFFEKDEVLVKLDPVDYETALVVSKAALAQAESMLAEEMAKAEQARENWKALGRTGEGPSGCCLCEGPNFESRTRSGKDPHSCTLRWSGLGAERGCRPVRDSGDHTR